MCIKLVNYWHKYTEMHGQQNVKKYGLFISVTALHVSAGVSTHHQQLMSLYPQYLVLLRPLLPPVVNVTGWDTTGSISGLNSARYCIYSDMSSWWWVETPPETSRAVTDINCIFFASCWTIIDTYQSDIYKFTRPYGLNHWHRRFIINRLAIIYIHSSFLTAYFWIIYYTTATQYTTLNTAKLWQILSIHVSANHGPSSWEKKSINPGNHTSICTVRYDSIFTGITNLFYTIIFQW